MSRMLNSYEIELKNKLQRTMSKREAEDAVLEIRENLYGNEYRQIHPIYLMDNDGNEKEIYPEIDDLISAYNSGEYDTEDLEIFMEE